MNCTSDFIFGTGISRVVRRKKSKTIDVKSDGKVVYTCSETQLVFVFTRAWAVLFLAG